MMETELPEIPKEILEPYPKDERSIVKMFLSMHDINGLRDPMKEEYS